MTCLIRTYDSSGIDGSLLKALLRAGFADLTLLLAENDAASHLAPSVAAAAKAAAGNWRQAVSLAVAEHKRSMYYPG